MMTEGRFASLPRSLHAHHTLGGGQDAGLSELPAAAYQPVSIHGTLPRRKRGGPLVCANTSQVPGHVHQPMISPVVQNIIDDFHGYREPATGLDATVDYVKFSRDQFILDCPSEKLRRELEEELKMNCEDPRSHAWYHGAIPRQVAENLVQRDGDFLIRDSLSSPGCYVLTCQWRNAAQHFKINKKVVMLNEAYSRVEYWLEREGFDNVPALIRYYVGNRKPVSQVVGAIIFQPINRGLPLRCLEEKYGIPSSHREAGSMAQERRSQKRLSLNITNGHDNGMGRGSQLRLDRCGSQPASLNQVPERRRPLKAHQSESFLPIGSKPQPQQTPDLLHPSPNPKSPVFRTGSEPALSPSVPRRSAEPLTDQTIRGSDSQLCPKPPPKPSKMLQARLPRSPCLQPLVPPSKWLQLSPARQRPSSLLGKEETNLPDCITDNGLELQLPLCSYVERLGKEEDTGERRGLDRSSYHHAIAALENTSEEEEDDGGREEEDGQKDKWREKESSGFHRPVIETESTFRPAEFGSRLLPPENKPLEMVVLKRAKELLLKHNHHSIARHLLMADCQVARILGVTPELKGQMGVSSGLELVTLPHGCQLRLDLMERHHTMAIGVAVDILGCTGSVEERASTLNRIILVALELKDTVGDLFAFTALMKALDLPQISRLEETWTTLRRNYTQTAISYEKTLKPFYKSLYEGTASCPPVVCVPLLLPLLTLMERPSITPEGPELWETSDQGCDIMLRHLEAARDVARNTQTYTNNAQKILQGFQCDNDLLEVFKTDFHLRLLWGSRGASVNQSDRYSKFNLILTALSRKLEPTPKTQTLI
uniref:Breast cancer anti-estrogen resistance protein 3-like n=1 Tax=Mastacembelus armatus TaxID=205130 RepID=A0A3Q3LWN7_9TELE